MLRTEEAYGYGACILIQNSGCSFVNASTVYRLLTYGAGIAQLVKSFVWQSIGLRFEPHCRRGVLLICAFSKLLTLSCYCGFESPL